VLVQLSATATLTTGQADMQCTLSLGLILCPSRVHVTLPAGMPGRFPKGLVLHLLHLPHPWKHPDCETRGGAQQQWQLLNKRLTASSSILGCGSGNLCCSSSSHLFSFYLSSPEMTPPAATAATATAAAACSIDHNVMPAACASSSSSSSSILCWRDHLYWQQLLEGCGHRHRRGLPLMDRVVLGRSTRAPC
jgi:hypothetical protein